MYTNPPPRNFAGIISELVWVGRSPERLKQDRGLATCTLYLQQTRPPVGKQ